MNEIVAPINFPYTAIDLTQSINVLPNMYGRLMQLDVFPAVGVTTTIVEIRFKDGVLTILPVRERGAEPTPSREGGENSIFLKVPHIPMQDTVTPADLQNKFVFGPERRRKTVQDATVEKLETVRMKHDITLEFLRMGALKGLIVDGEGTTIYNLFDVFGVTKKSINFELNSDTTDVNKKCYDVIRHIEDNLKGEVMSSVHALVSKEFFDALTTHPNVEKFYLNWTAATTLSGDPRRGFPFGGMVFEEYNAVASDVAGVSQRFIAANAGHAWPRGTLNTFRTHMAPPDHVNWVNTEGVDVFVSPKVLDHGRGVEFLSQSNPLPVCARPALLVELLAQ